MHFALLVPLAALPWLQGFFAPQGVSEQGSRDVLAELAEYREPMDDCVATAYGGLRLQADVTPARNRRRHHRMVITKLILGASPERIPLGFIPTFFCRELGPVENEAREDAQTRRADAQRHERDSVGVKLSLQQHGARRI